MIENKRGYEGGMARSSQFFYSYKALHSQPCVLLKMDYRFIAGLPLATIDDWLQNYLSLSVEGLPGDAKAEAVAEDQEAERQASAVIARALLLYGELATIAGIPCTEPGRVLAVETIPERPEHLRVTLSLQVMDNLPLAVFADALRDALELLTKALVVPPERARAEELMRQIEEGPMAAMAKQTPFPVRHQSILDMANRHNVPYRHLGGGVMRLGWGSRSRLLSVSATQGDSTIAQEICGNKQTTARVLRAAGFPGAENVLVTNAVEAAAAARAFGWPVVVKPPHRERSEGVTTDIRSEADLRDAYRAAAQYDPQVLVERHVAGDCHRIFVAGGRVIYVVRRMPKGVRGDGQHTIEELAEQENRANMARPRWRRLKPWPLDALADEVLAKQGLSRIAVPTAGQRVLLREITSNEWGGESVNHTRDIHPDNARLAIEVTQLLGMTICGVDLIITDITRPWHELGGIINELNFKPEFRWWDREEQSMAVMPVLIEGDGRIPVHLVVGEDRPLEPARALRAEIARQGLACHLTTAVYSEDGDGRELQLPQGTLFERSLALAMRPSVAALVVAGSQADVASHGFAVDRFTSAIVIDADAARAEATVERLRAQVVISAWQRVDP